MANYRVKLTYQIVDIAPNPDVFVFPSSANNQFQTIDAGSAEEVKQLLITNAQARVAAGTATVERDQAILDALNPPPPPPPEP